MKTQKLVGVDSHKDTIACYCGGRFREFKTTLNGFKQALKWAPNARWAVEGAYCFGKPFSAFLIKNGCEVFEVNPLLTKSWRGALNVSRPKNDYGDAKVISLFADSCSLQKVSLATVRLKEKLTSRKLVVKQKTETTNSIKMLFYTRGEVLQFKNLTSKKAIKWLESGEDVILKNYAKILKAQIETIAALEEEIEKEMPEKARKLRELKGISSITASTIYTETKGRLISAKSLASYAGIAPIDCSSGKTNKKKNNKGANRILNSCFYSLSIAQKRYDPKAKEYYEKKLSEGKTPRQARKCLARQLVNIVFRLLNS
jgi:transposase